MTRILLVEDNEMNRDMLSRRLARKGFEVLLATDGEQAVTMTVAELPDLVLLDMNLPLKDGWSAAREIRADPRCRGIPIIALTAHAMSDDRAVRWRRAATTTRPSRSTSRACSTRSRHCSRHAAARTPRHEPAATADDRDLQRAAAVRGQRRHLFDRQPHHPRFARRGQRRGAGPDQRQHVRQDMDDVHKQLLVLVTLHESTGQGISAPEAERTREAIAGLRQLIARMERNTNEDSAAAHAALQAHAQTLFADWENVLSELRRQGTRGLSAAELKAAYAGVERALAEFEAP
jgi:two-component system cell cycle response regulator DivK